MPGARGLRRAVWQRPATGALIGPPWRWPRADPKRAAITALASERAIANRSRTGS